MENSKGSENNREVFEVMPVPKALATLAVPTIIAQLIVLVYNLADTYFIGRTNDPLMVAGVSLILPVFNLSISLACLTGVGGGSLISRLLGVGNYAMAKKVSSFSFYLSALIAVCFSVCTALFMDPLLVFLGAKDEILVFARQYAYCVIVLGGIPTVLSMNMANLLRSTGCAKQAGFGVSMGGVINMALDPLFMFVLLPKGMEIVGAGLATMCSNLISCIYFFIVIFRMRGGSVISFALNEGLPGKAEMISIFSVGVPASFATFLFDVDHVVINKLATGYGSTPLAAIGIVLKAERLPLNIGIGLSQAMVPLAAYNYSAGNHKRMKDTVNFSRLAGLVMAGVSILLYELFAGEILRFFIDDPETVAIGANFLRVRCLATPFMFMCFHIVHLFQAVGHGDKSLLLAVVRWVVFNIPMLYILNHIFGMYGIVWTQMIADMLTVAVSLYVYGRFERESLITAEPGGA